MEKKMFLVEQSPWAFKTEIHCNLKESLEIKENENTLVLKGVPCTVLDRKNQNGRVYPKTMMQKAIDQSQQYIDSRSALCQAHDHPEGTFVKPIDASHLVVKAYIQDVPNVGPVLFNDWEILPTSNGKDLAALIKSNVSMGTSIRGLGNMTGNTVSDYEFFGTDVVGNPSSGTFTRMFDKPVIVESVSLKESDEENINLQNGDEVNVEFNNEEENNNNSSENNNEENSENNNFENENEENMENNNSNFENNEDSLEEGLGGGAANFVTNNPSSKEFFVSDYGTDEEFPDGFVELNGNGEKLPLYTDEEGRQFFYTGPDSYEEPYYLDDCSFAQDNYSNDAYFNNSSFYANNEDGYGEDTNMSFVNNYANNYSNQTTLGENTMVKVDNSDLPELQMQKGNSATGVHASPADIAGRKTAKVTDEKNPAMNVLKHGPNKIVGYAPAPADAKKLKLQTYDTNNVLAREKVKLESRCKELATMLAENRQNLADYAEKYNESQKIVQTLVGQLAAYTESLDNKAPEEYKAEVEKRYNDLKESADREYNSRKEQAVTYVSNLMKEAEAKYKALNESCNTKLAEKDDEISKLSVALEESKKSKEDLKKANEEDKEKLKKNSKKVVKESIEILSEKAADINEKLVKESVDLISKALKESSKVHDRLNQEINSQKELIEQVDRYFEIACTINDSLSEALNDECNGKCCKRRKETPMRRARQHR